MKPRTKEQEKLVEWSNHFPALTERQKRYAIRHCFGGCDYVFGIRGWFYRPATRTLWKGQSVKSVHDCDKISSPMHTGNKELTVLHRSRHCDKAYFVLLTTKGGYQCARWFLIYRDVKVTWKPYVKHEADYTFHTVGVEWLDSNGKLWSIEKWRNTMSWNRDQWATWSEMELRKYDLFIDYLDPSAILVQSLLPIVRRNGYKLGVSTNNHALATIRALLVDSEFESWYKCGHYAVCNDFLGSCYGSLAMPTYKTVHKSETHKTIVRLANRRHIKFDTSEKWRDMLDYVSQLRQLNMDFHNPSILFPKDFQKAHAELQRRINKRDEQQRREHEAWMHLRQAKDKAKKKDTQIWVDKYAAMFQSLDIKSGDLEIKPLISFKDFKNESDWMHHCIITYYGKPHTLLVSIRRNGIRMETAEIDLTRNGTLIQCRGQYNQPSICHDRIVGLLNDNMDKFIKRYQDYYKKQKKKRAEKAMLPVPMSFYQFQYKVAI